MRLKYLIFMQDKISVNRLNNNIKRIILSIKKYLINKNYLTPGHCLSNFERIIFPFLSVYSFQYGKVAH